MSEATPRPWVVNGFGGDFRTVARVGVVAVSARSESGDDIENARLIVRAVNLHDELLQCLKDIEWDEYEVPTCMPSRERVEAAIAKAEGA